MRSYSLLVPAYAPTLGSCSLTYEPQRLKFSQRSPIHSTILNLATPQHLQVVRPVGGSTPKAQPVFAQLSSYQPGYAP